MRLSLLIATRARPEMLAETLSSLSRCDPPPDEVLIVDGDEAGSARAAVEAFGARPGAAPARYLQASPGLPHQRNVGVEAAAGDVVVFADDDVEFASDVFAVLRRAYADPLTVGATARIEESESRRVGGRRSRLRRLLPGGGREGTMTRFGYPRRIVTADEPREVEFMTGCFMSARRDVAREVGFDENLPGYGLAEDEDFSYRLSRRGRIRYLPEARIVHHNTGFLSHGSREFNRMLVVNRAYLFRKNFPRTLLARTQFALLVGLLVAHRAANGEWPGVRGLLEGSREALRRSGSVPGPAQ